MMAWRRQSSWLFGLLLWVLPALVSAQDPIGSDTRPVSPSASLQAPMASAPDQEPGSPPLLLGSSQEPGSLQPAQLDLSVTGKKEERPWFFRRLFNAYVDEFKGTAPAGKSCLVEHCPPRGMRRRFLVQNTRGIRLSASHTAPRNIL